ncbi:MAG: hypothetical protein IJT07_02280 [Oscillospiraceae bacterium]|nr:hypothetical protein [Oscillospiraceae bacterium]
MIILRRLGAFALLCAMLCVMCAAASVTIERATISGGEVTVRGTADGGAVIVAFYDADGKMLAAQTAAVQDGAWSVGGSFDTAASVKAFILDDGMAPLASCAEAEVQERTAVEVRSEAELIAANAGDCDVIVVAESFELTGDLTINKDLLIKDGVTLTNSATIQCNGRVACEGSGKIVDNNGLFTVEYGIETIEGDLGDDWG